MKILRYAVQLMSQRSKYNTALWLLGMFCASVTLHAQTLNWSSPIEYSPITIGAEGGVGAANFLGQIYLAFVSNTAATNGGQVEMTTTTDGVNYSAPVAISGGFENLLGALGDPALAVWNSQLYLSYVNQVDRAVYYTSSSDGVTFANPVKCSDSQSGTGSTSMAVLGSNLYIGYRTVSGTFGLCTAHSDGTFQNTWYNQFSLGLSPALGSFNNTLYVAFRDSSSNHFIYLLTSTDGVNLSLNTAATGSHTSTADSLAIHNGVLYIGFRQNDSGNRFYYNYTTDGANFSGPIEVHWTMGGPPSLVDYNGVLFNFFRQNDTGRYLFSARGQ